ncbi:MAG: sulfatase [Deltaproteobacteria bacterium]|nr:sulfatase [Deltaproteobacteria bacterium]
MAMKVTATNRLSQLVPSAATATVTVATAAILLAGTLRGATDGSARRSSGWNDSIHRMLRYAAAPRRRSHQNRAPTNWGPAWRLTDNRAITSLYFRSGLVLYAGQPDFAKYVLGTWKNPWILNQTADGRPVAFVYGRKADILLPAKSQFLAMATHMPAGSLTGIIVVHNQVRRQKILLRLNGKTILRPTLLSKGRNVVRFQVDTGSLAEHVNRLTVIFRRSRRRSDIPMPAWRSTGRYGLRHRKVPLSAGAVEAVGIGPSGFALPPGPPATDGYVDRTSSQGLVRIPARGAVRFSMVPPKAARLRFRYQGPGSFVVRFRRDGMPDRIVFHARGTKRWRKADIALPDTNEGAVAIELSNPAATGQWSNVRIDTPATPRHRIVPTHIKYVFIWLSDALRRDCVGIYGSHVQTPNFDALARKGVWFERATIQGNHSLPGQGSILTGRYPPVHTFETPRNKVKGTLLYQVFRRAGFVTAMFSSNGYVSDRWGFRRGLNKYINFIRRGLNSDAAHLWKRAGHYLANHRSQPVFMYLATIDPHVSYDPPKRFLKLYWPGRYHGPVPRRVTGMTLGKYITRRVRLRARDLRRLKALYQGEVSFNDFWFGKMIADLKRMGIYDQSLIIMTADHGEQFHEHGSFGHDKSLYEEEIGVPLIFWWKGIQQSIRIHNRVEVMDLFATALDVSGLKPPATNQSGSLLPMIRGGGHIMPQAAFAVHAGAQRAILVGRYKWLTRRPQSSLLYDLQADPGEQHPLATTDHAVAEDLCRTLFSLQNAYMTRWKKNRWGTPTQLKPAFSKDLETRLPKSR